MQSWRTMTVGDLANGISRYKPFLLIAGAILFVAVVLPGPQSDDTSSAVTESGGSVFAGGSEGEDESAAGPGVSLDTRSSRTGSTGGTTPTVGPGGAIALPKGKLVANCDTATGRIKIPTIYAPPCVAAYNGQNGGATTPGVTDKAIKITLYRPQASAATTAALTAAGAANSAEDTLETFKAYVAFFQAHYNLSGRKVELSIKEGSGEATDDAAAQADAIDIAKRIRPFAVTTAGGGGTLNSFSQTLAANKIICVCGVSQPREFYEKQSPYLGYTTLMSSTQGYIHRSEYICKRLKTDKAKWAGFRDSPADPMADEKRVYGLLYFETNDKAYKSGVDFFDAQLKKCGITLKNKLEFIYPLEQVQAQSGPMISRMKADGVTSVIFSGDPITPAIFTTEASRQRWFPEWIVTGSALTDTNLFARTYDQAQWDKAFGISYLTALFPPELDDSYLVHQWHFGRGPTADNAYPVIYSTPFIMFTGIHMAGPDLTPQTFQRALFSYPVTGGGVTAPMSSFGDHGLWPFPDFTRYDDVTEIWWDPDAQGPDQVGNQGKGMYRYVDGGKRYVPGSHPSRVPRVFDPANSPTFYAQRPPGDRPPNYPPPKR